jgi:hypothetical protein
LISIKTEATWDGYSLRKALESQADEVARRLAGRVAEGARARVPVKSGRLRGSIAVHPSGGGFDVVADLPYAAAIELGSSRNRGHAQPYLAPALADAYGAFAAVARDVAAGGNLGIRASS